MDFGADGLKTGNIDEKSGYGLVGSAVQNGQRLILALYGASIRQGTRRGSAQDFPLGISFVRFPKTIFQAGETIGSAKVYGGSLLRMCLWSPSEEVKILIPRTATEKVTGRIVYTGPLIAPVKAGSEVARLKIFRGTEQILDLPLKTALAVGQGSLPRRAMDAGIEYATVIIRKYVIKR